MARRGATVAGVVALAIVAVHCTFTDGGEDTGLTVDVVCAAPAAPASVSTDLGYEVTIGRGEVALARLEIFACAEASVTRRARWGGLAVAHAHDATEPTKLGVPAVLPLAPTAAVELDLGTLEPPPGRYCTARATLAPADGDAVGMPDDAGMVGLSLLIEGTFARDGEDPTPFRFASSSAVSADMPAAFELADAGSHAARVRVVLDTATALDGVDFARGDDAASAAQILANLGSRLAADVE